MVDQRTDQTPIVRQIQPSENIHREVETVTSEVQRASGNQETLTAINALVILYSYFLS